MWRNASNESGNRLTNDGTWTYTYDDEGNLKTKANSGGSAVTWTYNYDNKNQLKSVEERLASNGALQWKVDFYYDAFASRIRKDVDSNGDGSPDTQERYWYDAWKTQSGRSGPFIGNENWDIWGDSDGTTTIHTNYLRTDKIDSLVARFGSGASNVRWTLTDYQGSVRNVLDSGGADKAVIAYDGYGKIASETDANERGRYTWTGREIDVETGLRYNRARYYDPNTARWISQDPLGFDAGDSNLYRYVNNQSTFTVDPSGLTIWEDSLGYAFNYFKQQEEKWLKQAGEKIEAVKSGLKEDVQGFDWSKDITKEDKKFFIETTWGFKVEIVPANNPNVAWCHTVSFGGLDNKKDGKYWAPTPDAIAAMLAAGEKIGVWKTIPDSEAKVGDIVVWKARGDAIAKWSLNKYWSDGRVIHSATIIENPGKGLDEKKTIFKSKNGHVEALKERTPWEDQKKAYGYGHSVGYKKEKWEDRVGDYQVWRYTKK